MSGFVKNYANWLLEIYSSVISVPKEMHLLNKAQKVWLIFACLFTVIAWLLAFLFLMVAMVNIVKGDSPEDLVFIGTAYLFGGFFLPLFAYWLIEAIYKLILWIRE